MVSPVEIAFCLNLVKRGVETVERVRELISVSPAEEKRLREFLEAAVVESALADRRAVLREFERSISAIERGRNVKPRRLSRNVRISRVQHSKPGAASRSL